MTLSHPERIDYSTRPPPPPPLQSKVPDTIEHIENFSEPLLPDIRVPTRLSCSGHAQYPYTATRYTSGHCTSTAGVSPVGRYLAKLGPVPSNIIPMSVPYPQAVVYPGYSNCAVYPAATRGSFSCLNRHPTDTIINEERANESSNSNSEDNPRQDSTPKSQNSHREVCRYFMRTGTCGYGDRCRFHHPQSAHQPRLNSMGYPHREAEHACPFYLKNGWCGFGATCKFNHPELPPLNVPMTTVMPQVLTHVSYSTVPQYANVPTPNGAYQIGTAAPLIHHWPVPRVAVNAPLSGTQQNGQLRSYVTTMPSWQNKNVENTVTAVESHEVNHSEIATQARLAKHGTTNSMKDATKRHLSPGSEDSMYSAVMGQDVSIPLNAITADGTMTSFQEAEGMRPLVCP
eukprot:g50.t1